ncbi:MAG: glycosyltransferase family 4 protein [Erysipelotrichaceae bacterium]|nr:glycosyltransferase family 4 protein [Erysipelotrichaceae bacterium]
MKILFYINVLYGGGAERVLSNLANHFCQSGDNVVLCTTFASEKDYPVSKNIKRIVFEDERYVCRNVFKRNVGRITKLRETIKNERPDIVVSFMGEPNFRSIIATRGLKTKIVVSVRNDPKREYPGAIGKFISHCLMPLSDGCVFQTKEAQQYFPKKLINKSKIILNDVKEEFFNVERKPEFGKIVSLGRLSPQKNQVLLLEAFEKLSKKYNDISLEIYGDGELKTDLEGKIKEYGLQNKAFLKGNTNDVTSVLSKADIFVLTSNFEGLPNALMEAMAVGVPSISTDCPCGGPKTLIQNGANGILIPVNDLDGLVNNIEKLLLDKELKISLGENAKKRSQDFTTDKVFEQWKEYLEEIVNSRN